MKIAKATNYQKQTLKMYQIKHKDPLSFKQAETLIKKQELKVKKQKDSSFPNNLEGSNLFSRWTEDEN